MWLTQKFDELFPELESLAIDNLFIHSSQIGHICRMPGMKLFLDFGSKKMGRIDPTNNFGILQAFFLNLLHHRNLNHIVVYTVSRVYKG